MISILRSAFVSIGVASVANFVLYLIESPFVFEFLKSNITNLQVALLALNTATLSIVLTKIRELMDKHDCQGIFVQTRKEMLSSIHEQLVLIVASLLIIAFSTAKKPFMVLPEFVYSTLLLSCFVYSILILHDTAKSVFVILDYK